jgi:putative SOS response-associated peptidase YedK
MRASGNLVELVSMNFTFSPSGPTGGPVFNFRSEGRSFANNSRSLIPAPALFEFTGKKYPKTKHRFTLNGAPLMAIAGIFREAKGANHPSSPMLTTEQDDDVKPFHNRQVVVVRPENWSAWPHLTTPEAELLRPLPPSSPAQETARPASD